jgi:hypothetical protein
MDNICARRRVGMAMVAALFAFGCGNTASGGSDDAQADADFGDGTPDDGTPDDGHGSDDVQADADSGDGPPDDGPGGDDALPGDDGSVPTEPPFLVGTAHSPMNLPISYWEGDIAAHNGGAIVDDAATADLLSGAISSPWFTTEDDAFAAYWALPGDAELTVVKPSGPWACPLDVADGISTGVRVPAGAHDPGYVDDKHIVIIDPDKNRIYAFYASASSAIGPDGSGNFIAEFGGCDLYRGDDAAIAATSDAAHRWSCTGGTCGMAGIGAGMTSGGNDCNGYANPHGVIFPQDFDDTGWSGEALGTLHHALYCAVPASIMNGYVWPMTDGGLNTADRHVHNGVIIRVDPAFVIPGDTPAWAARIIRTFQVYGCVLGDYGSGLKLSGQGNWDGLGPARGANPWSAAGGAGPEAQEAAAAASGNGAVFVPDFPLDSLQVLFPLSDVFGCSGSC